MCSRPSRPLGQATRGKTGVNRLRRVDTYLTLAHPHVLRGGSPLVVDLGFGARPWTTLEMAERWSRLNPELQVLGIEIDPERVAAALPHAEPPLVDFRLGGFDVARVLEGKHARVVRCMNVLRQYQEDEVRAALARIAEAMEPGGLLLEGTTDPLGRLTVFDVYRAEGNARLEHQALVFATNFKEPVSPAEFRTRAPKRLIHRMLDDEPARFFGDWERAAAVARATCEPGTSAHWTRAARTLAELGPWPVDLRPRLLERGFLAVSTPLR